MKQENYDENYDIETARLYSYFSDGYNYGLKRFKEIANDNPDYFEIDSLKNINVVINDMLKPSADHNIEDVENNIDEIEENKKTLTKDELLKHEKEIFELAKDGIISEFSLDYVVGFRDGYGYGKDYEKSMLKDISMYSSLAKIINGLKEELNKIKNIENEHAKIDGIYSCINFKDVQTEFAEECRKEYKILENNKLKLPSIKNYYFGLIERIKKLGVTDKFLNTIIENDVKNFDISIDEAIKIINNYKMTVDDVELSIKELKSMLKINNFTQ